MSDACLKRHYGAAHIPNKEIGPNLAWGKSRANYHRVFTIQCLGPSWLAVGECIIDRVEPGLKRTAEESDDTCTNRLPPVTTPLRVITFSKRHRLCHISTRFRDIVATQPKH